ncbi:hypothetical protein CWI42_040270 [Ordospora colligata]|uniref:DUF5096 domain-containing protein n=1 Tax=Ordospora colligata OC4 TaxID=1354746 RepID=A0A0B2ULI8_9MICR|nr:uncharacterized protein M896_040270 [Ordospora colligata OC4]KHN69835.1 hypothetical protein M896_040270 [Ordospora colligata OC4]TBU16005.1 hypothetical protein CWI41_040270 [Ordospora colligata]TBU16218.1 hypothetical protein CWI40_040270 [Ordospora colligata]TBU18922.1 hypothetical protein CWI42_040270 [Ordospora colligata]
MDEYIGTQLLFETSKGIVSGILKTVDEDTGKLVVDGGGDVREVFIEDVLKLEIVKEGHYKPRRDSKTEDKRGMEDVFLALPEQVAVASRSVSESCSVSRGGSDVDSEREQGIKSLHKKAEDGCIENEDNCSASEKIGINGKDGRYAPETTESIYYGMMSRAFSHFGPLEEEFSSIAARQAYRVFSTYFGSSTEKVEIFIAGDDVFSCVGYILARLLLHSGKKPLVICNQQYIRNSKYRQSYINSGGAICTSSQDQACVYVFACNKALIHVQEYNNKDAKGFIYLDVPDTSTKEGGVKIGLCFGSIPAYYKRFNGIIYFIDIEYPTALYNEFGMERPVRSKIHKIK